MLFRLGFRVEREARFRGSGFGVQGLGIRVWGSGCGVQGLGIRVWGSGFGSEVVSYKTTFAQNIACARGSEGLGLLG